MLEYESMTIVELQDLLEKHYNELDSLSNRIWPSECDAITEVRRLLTIIRGIVDELIARATSFLEG